ncbi:hypothetical protein NT6N_37150 [Oceaniferula spumae]|uniref:FMN-binding domain-containing protein n=1 Tax=Oceaniferula spumae TaxID=2979115 RepID=A0AAT9FRW6_9BACT
MTSPFKRISTLALRALTIASVFACIGVIAYQNETRQTNTLQLSVSGVTEWFPNAASLGKPGGNLDATPVLSSDHQILGYLLKTSPASNQIIGYSGPTNTLVALSPEHKIIGFRILDTADTSSHVAKIDANFWSQFTGRSPATLPAKPVTTSGATLTTEAIAKGIRARLTGKEVEPWFSGNVTPELARRYFPSTAKVLPDGKTYMAIDPSNNTLGRLMLSTDCPDQARGFQGPSALLIALSADQQTLLGFTLLASRDNTTYVADNQEELRYTDQFNNQPVDAILADNTPATEALLVSGASYTATAIVAQLRSTLRWLRASVSPEPPKFHWQLRDTLLCIWLFAGVAIGLTHWRGNRKVRLGLQFLCILLGGVYLGTLVTQGLIIGWARHGLPWQTYPALVLLTAAAIIIPLATGKNVYCQQLCAHGALQNTLFDLTKKKLHVPPKLHKTLTFVPWILLLMILVLALLQWTGDFSVFETFDAWSTGLIVSVPVLLFIASIVSAPFVRTPYCHYACPTGALLRLTGGPKNQLLRRDIAAAAFAVSAWAFTLF